MATVVESIQETKQKINLPLKRSIYYYTGAIAYNDPTFFQNNPLVTYILENNTGESYDQNLGNKTFVDARESIKSQYNDLAERYTNISLGKVRSTSLKTLDKILRLDPDTVSYELLDDESILFVFMVDDFTFFLQQFFLVIEDGDEALLSVYRGDNKLPSHAGTIKSILEAVIRSVDNAIYAFI